MGKLKEQNSVFFKNYEKLMLVKKNKNSKNDFL
jgi:hypothetical protein